MNESPSPARPAEHADSTAAHADGWADLLSGRHLASVLVMASGVLLYAMNLYFTAALMPSIVEDIGGQAYYAWVTTAFVVSAIVGSLSVSRILDWKGSAAAYLIAFSIFFVGAIGNATNPTMELLIASRAVQGLGGGLLVGLGYAVIRTALPARHWARAAGVVSAMWGVGTLFGPALGGLFAELGLWRASYAALAAVALLLAAVVRRSFAGSAGSGHRAPVPAVSLFVLILATLAISLSAVVPMGWPALAAIGIGLALLGLFIAVERRSRHTILPALAYQRGNTLKWVYLTVAALSAGVVMENFIPLFAQRLAGLSPLLAGLLGAVLSLAWTCAQLFIVSVRADATRRRAIRLGPLLLAAALIGYGLLQTDGAGPSTVAAWAVLLAVAGTGIGLAWPLLGVAAMSSTQDAAEGGKAAAAISTTQLIALSITSALGGTLMAAGGESIADAARYATLGIALLVLPGVFTARIVTRQ